MKGIIFTKLMEMVELEYGYDTVDKVLSNSNLEHKGSYTSVGHYPFTEMVTILDELSKETSRPVQTHMQQLGKFIFEYFIDAHTTFLSQHNTLFDFLESVENHIHIEVKKLYPKAELPTFETERVNEEHLKMTYNSKRKMSHFAHGIIQKASQYYNQPCSIQSEEITENKEKVLFHIYLN